MKTLVACFATALVVVVGANGYNAAVTPAQINTLKAQVNTLKAQATSLQSQLNTVKTSLSSVQSSTSGSASTVSCLQKNWNAIELFSSDIYAINSVKYNSSTVGPIQPLTIVMINPSNASTC